MFIDNRGATARLSVVLRQPAWPQTMTRALHAMASSWDLVFSDVIYPTSDDYSTWESGDIAVAEGVISALGPGLPRRARRVVDSPNLIALPSLYNMHTHAHDIFWRGSRDGSGVDRDWPEWFWDAYGKVTPETLVVAATATYAASLAGGVTFLLDHLRQGLLAAPFQDAIRRTGIDGIAFSTVLKDAGTAVALPHETAPEFQGAMERVAASKVGLVSIHAQETTHRLERVYQTFGCSTVELLDRYGLLHTGTFLIHLCKHSTADLRLIAKRGAHVVVTPTAEMRLGERSLDPDTAAEYGISLLIGTDGPAYHASDDLFHDIRLLALQWAAARGPAAVRPGQLLSMATARAAMALGRPLSAVAVGARANLVFVGAGGLDMQPLVRRPFDNMSSQLVYGASRATVRYVVVGGVLLVREARCVFVDSEAALVKLRTAVARHFELHG